MYVRLGFSVAINVNPDILLVDEVLAVGDESFQAKCLDRISRLQQAGKTIVLVTQTRIWPPPSPTVSYGWRKAT